MAGQPEWMREGIRFLDETPTTSGPPPAPGRRARQEWPVGLLTFLAVVGAGVAWKWGGEAPRDADSREVIERRFDVGPAPRIEVEAGDDAVRRAPKLSAQALFEHQRYVSQR